MSENLKSGKEMLDDFFANISNIKGVDNILAKELQDMYSNGTLTEKNVKNAISKLRENESNEN